LHDLFLRSRSPPSCAHANRTGGAKSILIAENHLICAQHIFNLCKMFPKFSKRFSDKYAAVAPGDDFIRRRISPAPIWITVIFAVIIAIFLGLITEIDRLGIPLAAAVSGILLFLLGLFFYLSLERVYDKVAAGEFQNAIFAGGAGAGSEFCLILKEDNTVVYSNPGYYRYFSYTVKGGHTDLDALYKSGGFSRENINRMMLAMAKHKPEKFELHLTNLEGQKRELDLILEPIRRPKGFFALRAIKKNIPGLPVQAAAIDSGIIPDIADSLGAGLYILRADNTIQYANERLCRDFGFEPTELINRMNFADLVFNRNKTLHDLDKNFTGALTFLDKNHQMFAARLNHFVSFSENGEIAKKYGLVALAPPQPKPIDGNRIDDAWRLFAENSPVAKIMIDEEGRALRANRSARTLLKKKEGEPAGWNVADAMNPENREDFLNLLAKTVKDENKYGNPISVRLAADSNSTASLYLSRLPGEYDNSGNNYLCDLIDTTEQKNLELRFVHSQKMQAVGQLAGGIAHDFNNLLTAMTGFCDLLLIRHPSGDPSFADIMQIKQNANRAANLVRQLLAFSRKQTLHPEVLDITDVLAELSNLVRRLIGENIELKIIHGRDLGLVKVDQGQFEQVIINLAVNARDAMQGGGTLTIRTGNIGVDKEHPIPKDLIPPAEDEVIAEGNYILIEVIDTGSGIPPEILGKIFEPFFSTKEVGQGTGLGLSTVYGIVKQTGGYIYVTSVPGKGTKFSIFLKSHAAAAEKPAEKPEESEKAITRDLTGVETILLVEDEDPVRIFSARALRNKGYSVLEADCGEAALEIVAKMGDEINVIITDVVMPGINGPTLVEQVVQKYPGIKVIFISGYAEDAFIKTYGSERKFNFLPKPFTLKQLASKVKEVVGKEK